MPAVHAESEIELSELQARLAAALDSAEAGPASSRVAAVVRTSGSAGEPRRVALSAAGLVASADATHRRLGGPGRWLLALPTRHVAGLQVVVRSVLSGHPPLALPLAGGFDPAEFIELAGRGGSAVRFYTALVPTQLVRLLAAGPAGEAALRRFDAVLVGGAALPAALRERAAAAGVPIIETYGMTETCGGCVYDGEPLDGVTVQLADDGRVAIGGPTVALGYLGRDGRLDRRLTGAAFRSDSSGRWFRTADLGRWQADRLQILGRVDEVVNSGGVKVPPTAVEAVLSQLPGVSEALVAGAPDAEWGERVVAAVVTAPEAATPTLDDVRAAVTRVLGPAAAPKQLLVLDALPLLGPGKPDRSALSDLAANPAGPAAGA